LSDVHPSLHLLETPKRLNARASAAAAQDRSGRRLQAVAPPGQLPNHLLASNRCRHNRSDDEWPPKRCPANRRALSHEPREIVSSALPGFFARGSSAAAPGSPGAAERPAIHQVTHGSPRRADLEGALRPKYLRPGLASESRCLGRAIPIAAAHAVSRPPIADTTPVGPTPRDRLATPQRVRDQ
jgi:hypothetical protein